MGKKHRTTNTSASDRAISRVISRQKSGSPAPKHAQPPSKRQPKQTSPQPLKAS